ncbi:MAG: hypothetical protein IT335_13090 [Thermomicrobiales bacterium]|nr:hypothetical protein [Thermomicrobiales bacterium]
MAERKVIHIEPESETGKLLKLVEVGPVSLEFEGKTFRIEQERHGKKDIFADYDPQKALESLRSLQGLFSDIDVEAFKRETLENREQNSVGRPAE